MAIRTAGGRRGGRTALGRRLLVPLVLVLLQVASAPALAWPGPEVPGGTPAVSLYVSQDGFPFQPLDPVTLADLPAEPPLDFGTRYPDWAVSADGATAVVIEEQQTIVVYDGLGGPERLRFEAPAAVVGPRLSHDGSRLVTGIPLFGSPSGITRETWYVFDTRDGGLISAIEEDGPDPKPGGLPGSLIDPAAERLYRSAANGEGDGPWPLQIVAHDLTSGAEIGRLTVPNVRTGERYDRWIDQVPIADVLTPAVALSPDGTRLAIVDAGAEELTLLDAATLTVVSTYAIARSRGLGARILTWLGLAPRTASAKSMDGRIIWATFSSDGTRLYVYGFEGEVGDDLDTATERGLGLTAIEVASGEIVASALDGQELFDVLPTPDRESLYVLGPTVPWAMSSGEPSYRLARLDAATLKTLAEREYPRSPWVVLIPAPAPVT